MDRLNGYWEELLALKFELFNSFTDIASITLGTVKKSSTIEKDVFLFVIVI